MTTFDKREEGFEKKFALDSEQTFKAGARRNKLLGLWAAEKLGLSRRAAALKNPPRRVIVTTSWLALRSRTPIAAIVPWHSSAALLSDNSAMPRPASTRRFRAVRLSTGVQSISPSPWV